MYKGYYHTTCIRKGHYYNILHLQGILSHDHMNKGHYHTIA